MKEFVWRWAHTVQTIRWLEYSECYVFMVKTDIVCNGRWRVGHRSDVWQSEWNSVFSTESLIVTWQNSRKLSTSSKPFQPSLVHTGSYGKCENEPMLEKIHNKQTDAATFNINSLFVVTSLSIQFRLDLNAGDMKTDYLIVKCSRNLSKNLKP